MTQDTTKNKGGRPTKAEAAAKGMTPTELDSVVRMLKRHFGPAMARAIEISSMTQLPLDKQFRMNVELAKLYVDMLRIQKQLRNGGSEAGDDDEERQPEAQRVFNLVK